MYWKSSVSLLLLFSIVSCDCYGNYGQHKQHGYHGNHGSQGNSRGKLREVFSWKQISYTVNGISYDNDTDSALNPNYKQGSTPNEDRYLIQYNNVPIGLEVFQDKVFVTVPRRQYGIPSTLNYVPVKSDKSPALHPYPSSQNNVLSTYRPRVDQCGRLWVVDTGIYEIPGARRQVQPPAIVIFDLSTDEEIMRYQLKPTDLVNERSSAGLTSITVDVTPPYCEDAYAYINDLATEGMIVFSLRQMDSWRINHPSFVHDEAATNFTVAGQIIPWKDGLFSIALSDPDRFGRKKVFYHPLASTQEFIVDTEVLKNREDLDEKFQLLGRRGPLSQSGTHAFHAGTGTILYANVAQDAILCWNTQTELTPENVAIVAQDHKKLIYISDLKIVSNDVWVLVNQITRFVYSKLDPNEENFFVHKGNVRELIKGTVCDQPRHHN